jgi:hypothetical protein
MANRAYLYAADILNPWPRHREPYYDSRWEIPFAWFFFYRPTDVYRAEISFEGTSWQETKLVANKDAAIALFRSHQPLLLDAVGPQLSTDAVEGFTEALARRPGRFLLLDPEEVFSGRHEDDTWHAAQITRILSILDSKGVEPRNVLAAAKTYVSYGFDAQPEEVSNAVLGYTYWE